MSDLAALSAIGQNSSWTAHLQDLLQASQQVGGMPQAVIPAKVLQVAPTGETQLPIGSLPGAQPASGVTAPASGNRTGFAEVLGGLVSGVDQKQKHSMEMARQVMTGESDSLHASMLAMQESSVAFTLMVEVRNKLMEAYQELMRVTV